MDDIRIVILQRGWIVVGKYRRKCNYCYIDEGFVIRRWGTTKGLGQLAYNGPLAETILDPVVDIEFHILTTIANIKCNYENWKDMF